MSRLLTFTRFATEANPNSTNCPSCCRGTQARKAPELCFRTVQDMALLFAPQGRNSPGRKVSKQHRNGKSEPTGRKCPQPGDDAISGAQIGSSIGLNAL